MRSENVSKIEGILFLLPPSLLHSHLVLLLAGGVLIVDIELGAGEHDHGTGGFLPLNHNNVHNKCDIPLYLICY